LEYGITIPTGASKVKIELCLVISNENNELTVSSRQFMNDLYNELVEKGRMSGENAFCIQMSGSQ
jgi:hypothetical protein